MKIVEGLKRLNSIEKKMNNNCDKIEEYSSQISIERPIFNDEKEQRAEILKLINNNKLLFEEYLKLKDRVNKTNNNTIITIEDRTGSIDDFLQINRKLGKLLINTYKSLNDSSGSKKLTHYRGDGAHIVRYYDEKFKNNQLDYMTNLMEKINSSLEVINGSTDIID